MAKKKPEQKPKRQIGWAEAARDIVVASINRGQLLLLGTIAIVLLIIYKIPNDEIVGLVKEIIAKLGNIALLSYILNIILALGWWFNAKYLRKIHSNECDRVGREKTKLQNDQLQLSKHRET